MSTKNKNAKSKVVQVVGKKAVAAFLKANNMGMHPLNASLKSTPSTPQPSSRSRTKKVTIQSQAPKILRSKSAPRSRSHKPAKISGKGDYNIKDAYNGVFENDTPSEGFVNKGARKIGEAVGNTFGFGRELGNATSKLARIFGFGDYSVDDPKVINHKYKVKHNSFVGNSPPTFSKGTGEDVIIERREYIRDLPATTQFHALKFFLNPGNPELFPWLSMFARGYEEYQFLGMVFEFKSMASAAAADGGGLTTVIMATDYDCLDENYDDKRTMENSEFSNSVKSSYSTLHPIECDPKRNVLGKMYVLPGITNVNQINTNLSGPLSDPRFDTLGQFYIATQGGEYPIEGSQLGEVWVSYRVRLSRPILEVGAATQNSVQTIHINPNTSGVPQTFSDGSQTYTSSLGNSVWAYDSFTNNGSTDLAINLRYLGTGTGYFMMHCSSRIKSTDSSTWIGNATDVANLSNTNVVMNTRLLKDSNNGTIPSTFFIASNPSNGGYNGYVSWDSVRVFSFAPAQFGTFPSGVSNAYQVIRVPIYVNTTTQCESVITIIGLPNLDNVGSKIQQILNNNKSYTLNRGNVETSSYLQNNQFDPNSSKNEIEVEEDSSSDDDDNQQTPDDYKYVNTPNTLAAKQRVEKKMKTKKHHSGCQD